MGDITFFPISDNLQYLKIILAAANPDLGNDVSCLCQKTK